MTVADPERGGMPDVPGFPIVDVSDWEVLLPEPGGTDANVWLFDEDASENALFKPVVQKDGRRQGEDWAEKLVEQVAKLVGVPSARITLASRRHTPGVLSYDLAPKGHELQAGAVLISEVDGRLVPRARERTGHNLANIKQVLDQLPAVGMPERFNAFDQFCGYLVLDALVANRDRHEENWAVLRDPGGHVTLAPSYDHGNSLGFNLLDEARVTELQRDARLERWATRGTAHRFEAGQHVDLVTFARRALDSATTGTGAFWLERVASLQADDLQVAMAATPEMSAACRTFSLQLLTTNQRRLLR